MDNGWVSSGGYDLSSPAACLPAGSRRCLAAGAEDCGGCLQFIHAHHPPSPVFPGDLQVDQLTSCLERSEQALRRLQQEAEAAKEVWAGFDAACTKTCSSCCTGCAQAAFLWHTQTSPAICHPAQFGSGHCRTGLTSSPYCRPGQLYCGLTSAPLLQCMLLTPPPHAALRGGSSRAACRGGGCPQHAARARVPGIRPGTGQSGAPQLRGMHVSMHASPSLRSAAS